MKRIRIAYRNRGKFLRQWINEFTKDSECVVELGSMFFQRLTFVHPSVPKKIGIEIWKPYIERATYHDCVKIHGDIRDFETLIDKDDMDCCMIIDVLEHFDKDTAIDLVQRIKNNFKKLLLFIPEGNHPQNKDVFKLGADKYQTHRSTWWAADIAQELDINPDGVVFCPRFHRKKGNGKGVLFITWERDTEENIL